MVEPFGLQTRAIPDPAMPDSDDALRFPVLLGDVGGTNARFAILHEAAGEPENFAVVATADHANIDAAIRSAVMSRGARPRSAVLALAAPIDGEAVDLTNSPWVVRPRELIDELGFEEIVLLNDFEAQALAVPGLNESALLSLGGGAARESANRVVVGPGTGLGVGGLVRAGDKWIPVAGEGGHVDLGPRTPRDHAIWPHLEPIEGRISAEQVLCGRGLVNLYRAISAADGESPIHASPAAITMAAIGGAAIGAAAIGKDERAKEAVDLFATYLSRIAGDLALIFMARGGVYIAGGIIQRILPILKPAEMRRAFEDKAPHSALMATIPLFAVTAPLAALSGLAAFAGDPQAFGIETAGRRWTRKPR